MSDRVSTDRNLLFGILAPQMDFISRDALVGAMNVWVIQKDKPLGEVLVERGELAKARRDLLEGLVDGRTGQASQPRLNHAASWAKLAMREGGAASEAQFASRAHNERKMDGGRNRIVARHERGGGLIGCSKWRRAWEGNSRFRSYYRAGQPPRFAR